MANLFRPQKLQKEASNVSTSSTGSNATIASIRSNQLSENDDFISLIDPPRKEFDMGLIFTKRDEFVNNCRKLKPETDVGPNVVKAICKCLANPNATICHIAQDLLMADLFKFKEYPQGLTEILVQLSKLPAMLHEFTDFARLKLSLEEYVAFCNLLQFKTKDDHEIFGIAQAWNHVFTIVSNVFSSYHPYYASIAKSLIEICPWKAMDMSKKKNLLEEIRKFLESHKDPNWRTLQEQHWFNQVFCQIWRKILSCIELSQPHEECLRLVNQIYNSCVETATPLSGCTLFTQTMLEIEIFYLTKSDVPATTKYFNDSMLRAIQFCSQSFPTEKKNIQAHDATRTVVKQHGIALINKMLHTNPEMFQSLFDETVNLYLVNFDSDTLSGLQTAHQEGQKEAVLTSIEKKVPDFAKILKKDTTSEHDILIILFFFREMAIKGLDFHSYVTIFESFLGRKNVSQLAAYVLEICNTHQPTTLVGKGNSWYSQVRHGNDADASQYFVTHLYKNLGLYSQDEAERVVGLMATDGKQNLDDEDYINHLMTVWYEIGQTHPGSLKKQKSLITDWRRKPQYAVKAQQLLDLMENSNGIIPVHHIKPVSEKLNGNPTVCMVVCSDYLVEMKLLQKNLQQAGYLCNLQRLDVPTYKIFPDSDSHVTIVGVTKSLCKLPSAKRQLTEIEKINFLIPLVLDKTQWPTDSSLKTIFLRQTPIDCGHVDQLRWDGDEFDELIDRLEQLCPQFTATRPPKPLRPKGILRSNSVSRKGKKVDFNDVLLFKEISSLSEQEMRPNSVTLEDIQLSGNYQPPTLIEDPSEADENWPDDIIEGQQKPSKNSRLPRIENRTFVPDNLSKSYTHGQSDNRRSVPYSSNNKPSRNGQQQYKKPPKADYEMPKLPSLYRQNLRRN